MHVHIYMYIYYVYIDVDVDVDADVDVDMDSSVGCLTWVSKSAQVLSNGTEAVVVLTLMIVK